jgi:hypothetical protein
VINVDRMRSSASKKDRGLMFPAPKTKTAKVQIAFRNPSRGSAVKSPHEKHTVASQRAKRISQKMEVFMLRVRCVSLKI